MRTIFVISGPAGGGKTVVIESMLRRDLPLSRVITTNSRPPRHDETDGVQYHFLSREEFQRRIEAGEFLEWAIVHEDYKGLQKKDVVNAPIDRDLILQLDVQGFHNIRNTFKASEEFRVVGIFLEPPSMEVLAQRMAMRGADINSEDTRIRLERSAPAEMEQRFVYDYIVINDELQKTLADVEKIIRDNLTPNQTRSLF